jgi:hypothetical protein
MPQKVRDAELPAKALKLSQTALEDDGPRRQNVAPLTRRTFLAASPAVSAGILAATGGAGKALAQSNGESAISSNFNGTPIPAGDWIWFTAVMKVHGLSSQPVTIGFMGSIEFSVNGTQYVVPVPSALVTLSPYVTLATTVFTNGQWVTTVPLSGLAGSVFFDGVAVQAPQPDGFPGGIQPVTWQGTFFSLTPGLEVQWQWAAAVYNNVNFGADYTQLGVKPVDDNKASVYQNSDHAGTPENFEAFVVGGARGGGGSNFTGSYSGTAATTPTPANMGGGGS